MLMLFLCSFGDQSDHDFIQSQPAGSNCFETKQCQNLKQYNHDCFDCQRNARYTTHTASLLIAPSQTRTKYKMATIFGLTYEDSSTNL